MDIRQLRYFVTVVDSGSFSAASAKLRISQPSIGQQVRNLEEKLGAPLLYRHSRGIAVTDAGQTLIALAREILQRVDDATRAIRDQSAEPRGELRLGLTVSAAAPLAADLVRHVTAFYPGIELSITEALSPHLVELLDQEHIDLALTYLNQYPDGIRGERLADEDFHFCVASDHQLAARPMVTLLEVLRHGLFLPPQSHLLTTQMEEAAARLGEHLRVRLVVQSIGILVDLVEQGLGVTVLPFSAVARRLGEGRMAAIPIVDPPLSRTMTLIYSARRPMRHAERALRDVIHRRVADKLQSGMLKWRVPSKARTG
jgi:LysR family transcriptional regulator, nitrogen assimilation regulatory protein